MRLNMCIDSCMGMGEQDAAAAIAAADARAAAAEGRAELLEAEVEPSSVPTLGMP